MPSNNVSVMTPKDVIKVTARKDFNAMTDHINAEVQTDMLLDAVGVQIYGTIVDSIVSMYLRTNKDKIEAWLSKISAENIAAKVTDRITNMVGQKYLNDILHGLGNKGAEKSAYS